MVLRTTWNKNLLFFFNKADLKQWQRSPFKVQAGCPWYLRDWDTLTVSPSWTSSIAGDQARWYWYDFYTLIFSCFYLHFRSYAKIPKIIALAESWNYNLECWEIDYWSIFVGNSLGDSFVCFCIIRSSSINKIFTLLKKKKGIFVILLWRSYSLGKGFLVVDKITISLWVFDFFFFFVYSLEYFLGDQTGDEKVYV